MLLQEPGVPEHLAAVLTPQGKPVLLLSVLLQLCPGVASESAALLWTGIPFVHFLVSLQFTGEAESHLTAFVGAPVWRQLSVLLTHVGLQLLVFLEREAAVRERADVLLLLLGVRAADVPGPVRVGGERLRAAVYGAAEGLHTAVGELVPRQVRRGAEGLTAALVLAGVWFNSRVFAQVSVKFPLFVVSSRAAGKRADETFIRPWFGFHFYLKVDKPRARCPPEH